MRKLIVAWCLYDWAISAFSTVVTTFIIATYFTTKIAPNTVDGTYLWGNMTALSGLTIAVISPLTGSIADHFGKNEKWLLFFTSLIVISTFFLWFSYPSIHSISLTLTLVFIGTIGLECAMVFYNSILPEVAQKDYMGRISGWGWATGYIGGLICLIFVLVILIQNTPSWLSSNTYEQIRITGPLVSLWVVIFSAPLFLLYKSRKKTHRSLLESVKFGLSGLKNTLSQFRQNKNVFTFYISHMFYIDGVNTLFAFGGIYAAGTFHMPMNEVILFGIVMNLSAGLGAMIFGWIDDFLGSKSTIVISLASLIFIGLLILFIQSKSLFWCLAFFLSLFFGPTQAASRTLMAKLAVEKQRAEMFGLYAMSGRITAFLCP